MHKFRNKEIKSTDEWSVLISIQIEGIYTRTRI